MEVQHTNDSSIVSKLSAAKKQYFKDDFLEIFVEKSQTRSPIINRGYYIRFKAMESVFKSWLEFFPQRSQIISLGAGFDSAYLRLKSQNILPSECKYIEVDFPGVMKKKAEYMKSSEFLNVDLSSPREAEDPVIVASSRDYIMLGLDLSNCKELIKYFKILELDFVIPTLFISECALTYMDVSSSDELIKVIQAHFSNSAFVLYEQISPGDGFGIVMQNHFSTLRCPLKSLLSYENIDAQCSRLKRMGWSICSGISMFDMFNGFSLKEKCRVKLLEPFDEYEIWHLKCQHYALIWACQGTVSLPKIFQTNCGTCKDSCLQSKMQNASWQLIPAPSLLHRYGHQTLLLPSKLLLIFGGFGSLEKQHQRLGGLVLYDSSSNDCYKIVVADENNLLNKRMFHRMLELSDGSIIVIGGRTSPNHSFDNIIALNYSNQEFRKESICDVSLSVSLKCTLPIGVWRHSVSVVVMGDEENIIIFGGCSVDKTVSNKCLIVNTISWKYTEMVNQCHTPSPRHSHSSISYESNKMLISCGLSQDETILNSVHVLDCEDLHWATLELVGLSPRYSHTSHFWKNKVFLVGGITADMNSILAVIDLTSLTVAELSPPCQDPEYPIMLSCHSSHLYEDSIIATGGGGNCFSFGTHFNSARVIFHLNNL